MVIHGYLHSYRLASMQRIYGFPEPCSDIFWECRFSKSLIRGFNDTGYISMMGNEGPKIMDNQCI